MASYSTPSSSPPPGPSRRRLNSCARACERGCCALATYFPLAFIYSLSTWGVWVIGNIGFGNTGSKNIWWGVQAISALGILFYLLANLSYTIAVFTDPGSPLKSTKSKQQGKYSILPTSEPASELGIVQNITVSSTGAPRFCKKCHTPKPDRTHHCSTCQRCVLKMDHHCPWLATCLGLHNYKAFVLFLIYLSLFSWTCFVNASWWMWKELFEKSGYLEDAAPVNIILLSVISGILGLVLTGFTAWHIYLCVKGQTTIEKLEKTRYLSGVRSRIERNRQEQHSSHLRRGSEGVAERLQRAGEQILEFHANAVPGASRYEEGEEHTSPVPSLYNPQNYSSPPQQPNNYTDRSNTTSTNDTPALRALRRTYSSIEAERERERYDEYLDDKESAKLPSAFDLGWRRNLLHLFGPNPFLWALPVCNTTGDGWSWEVSHKWAVAQEELSKKKERRLAEAANQRHAAYGGDVNLRGGGGRYEAYERDRDHDSDDENHLYHHQQIHGYGNNEDEEDFYSHSAMSMRTLPQRGQPQYPTDVPDRGRRRQHRDFDMTESGEIGSFEVSSDDDSDSNSDVAYKDDADIKRGRARRKRVPG